MRRTLIRYKAKPELADRNAELVSAVFAELKAARPDGVRYAWNGLERTAAMRKRLSGLTAIARARL
jgi:hypothetical protein